jgi:hypothetical protein
MEEEYEEEPNDPLPIKHAIRAATREKEDSIISEKNE